VSDDVSHTELAVEIGRVQQQLDDYIKVHGVTKAEVKALESKADRQHANLMDKVEANAQGIEEIKESMTKYKGFVAGMLFVFGAIWGLMLFLKTWILKIITGGI